MVLTTPITTIATSWVTSHRRSTVAIRVRTSPAWSRAPRGNRRIRPA